MATSNMNITATEVNIPENVPSYERFPNGELDIPVFPPNEDDPTVELPRPNTVENPYELLAGYKWRGMPIGIAKPPSSVWNELCIPGCKYPGEVDDPDELEPIPDDVDTVEEDVAEEAK